MMRYPLFKETNNMVMIQDYQVRGAEGGGLVVCHASFHWKGHASMKKRTDRYVKIYESPWKPIFQLQDQLLSKKRF